MRCLGIVWDVWGWSGMFGNSLGCLGIVWEFGNSLGCLGIV
jgi:hypothetical protein